MGFAGVVYTTIMKTVDSNAFIGFEMNVSWCCGFGEYQSLVAQAACLVRC